MEKKKSPLYIDLFSGCGGFSLGLGNAGWQGLFAVEKDSMAFETFKHNLIDGDFGHFSWPEWLPKKATTIQNLLKIYPTELAKLKGKVDLIAGGPPCQGFSLAGMRNSKDPRNKMSQEYIKMVELVRPKYLVLENVRGFNAAFKKGKGESKKAPYSEIVKAEIESLDYEVFTDFVHSEMFGVPQQRTRFIMIGVQKELCQEGLDPFEQLESLRSEFLNNKGLPLNQVVTVKDAISDLEISRRGAKLIAHSGSESKGFKKLDYVAPSSMTGYQSLMRKDLNGYKPNSMRLARHKESTIEKFNLIRQISRPGVSLNDSEKEIVGTKKQAICVLHPKKPSKTITTLPDDLLHYKESRILTVRESARVQSFPDNFEFRGKYTTGGKRRKKECPRYTQVGNAVPPLIGEVIGRMIHKLSSKEFS